MKDLQVSSISLSICVMKASCTTFMIKLMKTHKMIRLGTICLISGCCSQCGFTHPPSTHVRISFKPTAPSCIGKDKWLHTVSHQDEKLTMDIPCRRSRKLNCGQRSFLVVSMQCITYHGIQFVACTGKVPTTKTIRDAGRKRENITSARHASEPASSGAYVTS
jgi:hypothetical protein